MPGDFENHETLVFRGLTYRYDAREAEWTLVDRAFAPSAVPETIEASRAHTTKGEQHYWRVGTTAATTPLKALEKWAKNVTALRAREAREAERVARDLRREAEIFARPSWKSRPRRVTAKG